MNESNDTGSHFKAVLFDFLEALIKHGGRAKARVCSDASAAHLKVVKCCSRISEIMNLLLRIRFCLVKN